MLQLAAIHHVQNGIAGIVIGAFAIWAAHSFRWNNDLLYRTWKAILGGARRRLRRRPEPRWCRRRRSGDDRAGNAVNHRLHLAYGALAASAFSFELVAADGQVRRNFAHTQTSAGTLARRPVRRSCFGSGGDRPVRRCALGRPAGAVAERSRGSSGPRPRSRYKAHAETGVIVVREWGLRILKPKAMLRLSVAGLALELLIASSTLAPNAPVVPQWPQFLLFPLIFVVHLSSVLRLNPERPLRWRELLAGVPPVAAAALVIIFVGAVLVLMASIGSIGGKPTMSGGRYYLDNHGSLTPVTKAAYEHALVLQQRIFTLGPSVFFALGALVHYRRPGNGARTLGRG